MAGIKISQLDSGGGVTSTDQLPVARDGSTTYRIPASQFVVNGVNAGSGTAQIFSDKNTAAGTTLRFRSLAGQDGVTVNTTGDTIYISASGQNPAKTAFVGNGTTTTWSINEAKSVNPNNYRVTIDGVIQEPNVDYTINLTNSTITFTSAPPPLGNVAVISNNLVRAYDIIPSDASVTTTKLALSAVTTATINNNAVTTEKIPTGAITNARLAFDGGAFGFRNKLINGDMRIDQRSAGAAYTNTINIANYGSCDRWLSYCQGSNITYQRVSGSSFGIPYPYAAIRLTGAANNTNANINQRIEAANCYDLAGQTVTVSFRVVSSTTLTNCYIGGYTATSTDTWNGTEATYAPGAKYFTSTTTPTVITHTFVMPNVLNGYEFIIGVGGTAGEGLLVGQTIDLTNVQLEVGPVATPFEYRPIQTELALCQRYYYKLGNPRSNNLSPRYLQLVAGTVDLNQLTVNSKFPVTMRTLPILTLGYTYDVNNSLRSDWATFRPGASQDAFVWLLYNSTGAGGINFMAGKQYWMDGYTADAEL